MNGIHDLGGMHGFGPVVQENNEPVFHAEWERRIFGALIVAAFNGLSVFDENRRAGEQMTPLEYLTSSYYGRWLHMIETMAVEKGIATRRELALGRSDPGGKTWPRDGIKREQAWTLFIGGGSARAQASEGPRFAVGDSVVSKNINPIGHTRLPRYARGKRGVINLRHGSFVYPDTRAHGRGDCPQHLYNVRFTARELWGAQASDRDAVYLDLWDSYLEPSRKEREA
jgi:nitrile hydratase beta subunit